MSGVWVLGLGVEEYDLRVEVQGFRVEGLGVEASG
jgi:hypothetical protein